MPFKHFSIRRVPQKRLKELTTSERGSPAYVKKNKHEKRDLFTCAKSHFRSWVVIDFPKQQWHPHISHEGTATLTYALWGGGGYHYLP
ncbi:hypothetical protein NPIL_250981 [Nephila pilipes]|uniref:Uncharacterized protein n=1 Tax=Nephila pilipes TaxID=299642 RepID=A0A8X6MQA7_NEPPI|nr:hypothetical protein NPIL_250981 [Nephila pilipes]